MKFKPGVRVFGVRPELTLAIIAVNSVYEAEGYDLVITSVTEGKHSRASLHYAGQAFDCRIWGIPELKLQEFVRILQQALTDEFDVVLEKDHIHIEFQPKR